MSAPAGLLYHAGGLGDFVLSLPAVHRLVQALGPLGWRYVGPSERRLLLPGFGPAPPALARSGHTLWGAAPAAEAVAALEACAAVVAFGGREPPAGLLRGGGTRVALRSFPGAGGPWVPAFQAAQLDRLGVGRVRERWLPAWREAVLPAGRPSVLVLHPGSGDPRKNLPGGVWLAAARALRERTGLPLLVTLGPAEEERGDWGELADVADEVVPCRTLGDLVGALAGARLFLGNDSGPSHVAAALGVPSLVVYGPSDACVWRPLGRRVRQLAAPLVCAPCSAGGPIACATRECLRALEPGPIVAAALELLAACA